MANQPCDEVADVGGGVLVTTRDTLAPGFWGLSRSGGESIAHGCKRTVGQLVPADGSLVVYADLARLISPRFDHAEALKVGGDIRQLLSQLGLSCTRAYLFRSGYLFRVG